MSLQIDLSADQQSRLREIASRYGLSEAELARAALVDMLTLPTEEFHSRVGCRRT